MHVLFGEMRREQYDAVQVQPTLSDRDEQLRESAGGSCCANALQGRVFGQAELLDAVGVHRGVAGGQEQSPSVHLRDVGQQERGALALLRETVGELPEETGIGQMRQRVALHGSLGGGERRGRPCSYSTTIFECLGTAQRRSSTRSSISPDEGAKSASPTICVRHEGRETWSGGFDNDGDRNVVKSSFAQENSKPQHALAHIARSRRSTDDPRKKITARSPSGTPRRVGPPVKIRQPSLRTPPRRRRRSLLRGR
jgi:hypothetical protein